MEIPGMYILIPMCGSPQKVSLYFLDELLRIVGAVCIAVARTHIYVCCRRKTTR